MIRKSMPSGYDPMGGYRFSLATNAERVCAEIMLSWSAMTTHHELIALQDRDAIPPGAISPAMKT
jgi:hypothetical protein